MKFKATDQLLSVREGVGLGRVHSGSPPVWCGQQPSPALLVSEVPDEKELGRQPSPTSPRAGSRAAPPRGPNAEEQQGDPASTAMSTSRSRWPTCWPWRSPWTTSRVF